MVVFVSFRMCSAFWIYLYESNILLSVVWFGATGEDKVNQWHTWHTKLGIVAIMIYDILNWTHLYFIAKHISIYLQVQLYLLRRSICW